MIVTEYELRANWHKTKAKIMTLPPGSVITPSARDFIRSKGIDVRIEGNGSLDINKANFSNTHQTVLPSKSCVDDLPQVPASTQAPSQAQNPAGFKPEHMTHLHQGALTPKTHPIIAYRGQLDLFQCELVEAQGYFEQTGEQELILHLEEIAAFARALMVSEVKEEPFQWATLLGLKPEELREHSHHPQTYFGVGHTPLSYTHGPIVGKLQHLRAKAREVELYANRAFTDDSGNCSRTDLIQALNRLSSAFYILACQVRARKTPPNTLIQPSLHQPSQYPQQQPPVHSPKLVPIGISNRHIHLSQADITTLFGENYTLTKKKELSQTGQYAAEETVTLLGPKGSLEKVRILGPARTKTQAEISVSDCYGLGIKAVLRDSGQHEGTPGLRVLGPAGQVDLESGVMVASRHLHMNTEEAAEWSLKDGDRVSIKVASPRPTIFQDVLVRVSDLYRKELHLDLDEANAALLNTQSQGRLLRGHTGGTP
ncbi:phosphate propanoyltransferase [Desulfosporosinus sp. SB140]|uniref:phosphate propanoyltransferase n=1 Tax=Desulfosporosinus paludis TaxID=3115649 RepID=UPI0038904CFD